MSNKTYKVYWLQSILYQSPTKQLAFTLLADPVKYHTELYNNGVLSAFLTRDSLTETQREGEEYVRRGNAS